MKNDVYSSFTLTRDKFYYQPTENKNDKLPGMSLSSQENVLVYLAQEPRCLKLEHIGTEHIKSTAMSIFLRWFFCHS